jgi:hypothetical protein
MCVARSLFVVEPMVFSVCPNCRLNESILHAFPLRRRVLSGVIHVYKVRSGGFDYIYKLVACSSHGYGLQPNIRQSIVVTIAKHS